MKCFPGITPDVVYEILQLYYFNLPPERQNLYISKLTIIFNRYEDWAKSRSDIIFLHMLHKKGLLHQFFNENINEMLSQND